MRPLRAILVACALAAALAGPPAGVAAAASPLSDCAASGRLSHHFTVAQLRHALATMPADVREYSNCYDVINNALLAELGGTGSGNGGSSSGSSFLPTPVLIVVIVLVVAAGGLGVVALRRRR